jgi:hypothetical protein
MHLESTSKKTTPGYVNDAVVEEYTEGQTVTCCVVPKSLSISRASRIRSTFSSLLPDRLIHASTLQKEVSSTIDLEISRRVDIIVNIVKKRCVVAPIEVRLLRYTSQLCVKPHKLRQCYDQTPRSQPSKNINHLSPPPLPSYFPFAACIFPSIVLLFALLSTCSALLKLL